MAEVLHIKNMVCDRCIMAVSSELEKLNINAKTVLLGEVELYDTLNSEVKDQLRNNLEKIGFELLEDKKHQLTERVKNIIIDLIHHKHTYLQINLSDYISEQIGLDYSSVSKQFSETEHTTIEKFVIAQKIERVKELISYNELTLSEIADHLHYSSVAHLSGQFKKVTGITPSEYKNSELKDRKTLDGV
jgi:AraC-like DNA-binding protein